MAVEQFELMFQSVKKITPQVYHFSFSRADQKPLRFIPGQFVSFLFEKEGKKKRRSYSIATIPGTTDAIELALSYVPDGLASEQLVHLKQGDTLPAVGPAGRLVLPEQDPRCLYLVGTGTGIAPYRAMLPALKERFKKNKALRVHLLLGVQYRQDALYWDDFLAFSEQESQFQCTVCYSREDLSSTKDVTEYSGYVQACLAECDLSPENDLVMLCGNPKMIDDAFVQLTDAGFDIKSIRREKYIST